MELPSGAAAPGPGSESTRPQASFTGNSSRDKDGVEPAVVEQPPVERWQRCLGQKWTTKNVPTAITLTKTTLQKLFAWQYGSSKQHLPTVIFNLALTGGEVVQLPPVTLNAPSRDDTVRLQRVQQGQGSAKVDGYQVPADTMKQIYGLLGVGVLPGGQLKFVSEGWHDGCLVLRVSLEPAAAQQAPTAAAAAARTGMAAAAPVASASVAAAGPAARAGIAATAAAAAAAAAVAAAPPAAARFSTMAATPVAVPATAAATTGTAAAAPVGSAPSAGERAGMGAAAAATAGSEQEAQSLPAGEQHAQQAAPPPQHEQNQQQPHLAPDQQVAGPAMSNATPQPGVAGSSLEMLAATAAGQGGGTPAGQQAGVVVSPLPSSNITPYARIRWLKGEELHELLCRPKEHGLVDTTKTFEAKPGVGDLYLCDKGNTLWKAVGHKWGPHRSNAVLKVKGEDAVKVHYCKTLDGALEARWYTLVDEDAPNARLQLLHFYRPKQYASEDSKPGPKSKKRKAGSERNPGSAKRQAGPAVSQQQAAGSAAGPAAAQAASGGAQAQPSKQQAEQQAASMQVDPPEPQAERQQGQGEQQQGGQPPEQQAQQLGTQQPAEQEGGQPPEQQAQQVGIQQPAEQEGGQGQQQRGQSRDRCADQLHGQHEQQLSADPQRSQQQQDKQPSAQIPATVASQRAEADDWRQRCLEAETRCQGFEKEQQVMSAQVAAAKQAAQETQEKAIQLRAELEVVQAELREKRRALEAVQQRCQIAEDKQRQAASQLAAVQRELAAEQARRKVVECQLADSRSLVQTLEAGQQRSRDSDSKLLQELAEARAAAEEAASLRRQLKSVQQQLESACAAQQGSQLSSDAARAAAVDAAGPSPDRPTTFAALRRMLLECKVAPSSMQLFLKQQIFEADAEKVAMHWDYLAGCYRDGDDGGVRDWVQLYAA